MEEQLKNIQAILWAIFIGVMVTLTLQIIKM